MLDIAYHTSRKGDEEGPPTYTAIDNRGGKQLLDGNTG